MVVRRFIFLGVAALVLVGSGVWAWQDHRYPAPAATREEALDVRAAERLAADDKIVLIDIRTPGEWRRTGVPSGAVAITMHQRADKFLKSVLAATEGRHDVPVALICATGGRSTKMLRELKEAGFTKVYNVVEGMNGSRFGPGWLKQGLPVRPAAPPR